jgi:protease-4
MLSASRPLDQGEREAMTLEIDGFYRDFVSIVAAGRKRSSDEIEKLARGRVYSGLDAHKVGLVDQIGDLGVATDWLRQALGETRPLGTRVIRPPRVTPKPPELPAPFVAALQSMGGERLFELGALALGVGPTETVLAWSGLPFETDP